MRYPLNLWRSKLNRLAAFMQDEDCSNLEAASARRQLIVQVKCMDRVEKPKGEDKRWRVEAEELSQYFHKLS